MPPGLVICVGIQAFIILSDLGFLVGVQTRGVCAGWGLGTEPSRHGLGGHVTKSVVGKSTCLPLRENRGSGMRENRGSPSVSLSTERRARQAFHKHRWGEREARKRWAKCGEREKQPLCRIPQTPALRA